MTTRQQKARHASYSRRALHLYESSLPMNTTPPVTPATIVAHLREVADRIEALDLPDLAACSVGVGVSVYDSRATEQLAHHLGASITTSSSGGTRWVEHDIPTRVPNHRAEVVFFAATEDADA